MKKIVIFLIISIGIVAVSMSQKTGNGRGQNINGGYVPDGGFVPDSATAVKIAEAIWLPIYGEKVLKEKPFVAKLEKDSVWIVQGTLKKGWMGGTAYIEIQKADCKILKVIHGK